MQIDKVEICRPIQTLIEELKSAGFVIIEQKVSDYHFHEVYIKMKGKLKSVTCISIDNIEKYDDDTYICKCHWSTVEIDDFG